MESCDRPAVEYPQRVPLKVIGKRDLLDPAAVAALILAHLGPQPEADRAHAERPHGAYVSFTFWVTLADDAVELPLRQAIQALPGVMLQL
jgi:putative lipoic acid-binding regulatory protein